MKTIRQKLLDKWNQATGCPHDTEAAAIRCYYKYTGCGPTLVFADDSISISSIVEGVDETTQIYTMRWPVKVRDIRRYMKAVEDEAQAIWDATHGCEKCGDEDESGYRAINKNCKNCNGEGVIL